MLTTLDNPTHLELQSKDLSSKIFILDMFFNSLFFGSMKIFKIKDPNILYESFNAPTREGYKR